MGRKRPTPIFEAWDDLVFRIVPWTAEERLRKWKPLFDQTWKDGKPTVAIDDAFLILSAGWGLHHEVESWYEAIQLLNIGRSVFDQLERSKRICLIESESWTYLQLGLENEFVACISELLDMNKPRDSTLWWIPYLFETWFEKSSGELLVTPTLRSVVVRYLETKKRKLDTKKAYGARTIGDLASIPALMPMLLKRRSDESPR